MSIPSTEFTPDRLRTQPQGQIRRYLGKASDQERQGFLDVLSHRAAIKPLSFILQVGLSLLLFVLALVYNKPLLLMVAALIVPAHNALLSLSLAPGTRSVARAGGAILALVLMAVAFFGGGYLAHELYTQEISAEALPFSFLLNDTWLEWLILLLSAIFTAYWFTSNSTLSRLSAIVFNVLIFVQMLLAGWQFARVGFEAAFPTLILSILRLLCVVVLMIIVLWSLRIKINGLAGWLIFVGLLLLLGAAAYFCYGNKLPVVIEEPEEYQEVQVTPALTLETTVEATFTPMPTATKQPEPSPTPRPTNTPQPSPTPLPLQGRVTSTTGLYCRNEPGGVEIIGVLAYQSIVQLTGKEVQINNRTWQELETDSGMICWVDDAFLEIIQP
ncbi:MAG: hypothetical protein GX884_00550 [Chloroflexi bacterium]|nr:hypothetical protein [Chloroflexota bacterium]